MPPKAAHLPVIFIADGQVLKDNQGVLDVSQVFYAEWEEGEGLLVQRYGQETLPPV